MHLCGVTAAVWALDFIGSGIYPLKQVHTPFEHNVFVPCLHSSFVVQSSPKPASEKLFDFFQVLFFKWKFALFVSFASFNFFALCNCNFSAVAMQLLCNCNFCKLQLQCKVFAISGICKKCCIGISGIAVQLFATLQFAISLTTFLQLQESRLQNAIEFAVKLQMQNCKLTSQASSIVVSEVAFQAKASTFSIFIFPAGGAKYIVALFVHHAMAAVSRFCKKAFYAFVIFLAPC